MAEWDTAYINDLPDSAFACIDPGGEKDEQGKTVPRSLRHYPHHSAGGSIDLPHLRNALSRVGQDDTTTCGVGHLREHASAEQVGGKTMHAVKFVDGSDTLIEGLAIPFGGPIAGKDLHGEDFGPDTNYEFDWYPTGRPVIYDHGLDGAMKTTVQGRQTEHEITDEGVWARVQLDTSAKYHATVARLVKAGKLFFSSGTAPQLVEVDETGHIKTWPWMELSLTPTPANPLAVVHAVKTADAIEHLQAVDLPIPAELIASALKRLDALTDDDELALPDGVKVADLIDRLSVDGPAWLKARRDWYAKSGRVPSATTRERLSRNPASLRELADDIDDFLSVTDPEKAAKDFSTHFLDYQRTLARLNGVEFPSEGVTS